MKFRLIAFAAILTLLLSGCVSLASDITPPPDYQSPTPAPTMSPLFPQAAPDLAAGAVIYAEKCAPCHGTNGMGDGDMSAKMQKKPTALGLPEVGRMAAPANWYTTVTQGNINSMMPPFKSLSDQQRWDVVAYAISLGGSTRSEAAAGQAVYEKNCLQCHGQAGDSIAKASFTDQSMMAKLNQTDIASFVDKGIGTMPGFGGLLSSEDIYAVAAYVRGFSVVAGDVTAQAASPEATETPLPAQETAAPADSAAQPDMTATPGIGVGAVSGVVSNGSGSAIPADMKISLHVFSHDPQQQSFSEVSTVDSTVAADGTYRFSDVEMDPNRAFFVTVDYSNTSFQSDPAFPEVGQNEINLPITIYEASTDKSQLVVSQVHFLLDYSRQDVVQVVEFWIFSNPGKTAIVSSEKNGPIVEVNLPKGYTNLQFETGAIGGRYIQTENGFADTATILPGSDKYQLTFAFDLPLSSGSLFSGKSLDVAQVMPIKANAVSVLVPEGVTVSGAGLQSSGLTDMGTGSKLQVYKGSGVEGGNTISFNAAGGAKSSGTDAASGTDSSKNNLIIGVGVFGLVLILGGAWMYYRDRKARQAEDLDDADDEDDEPDSEDQILDAILVLDDQFKSGKINAEAYKERRNELKSRLPKRP